MNNNKQNDLGVLKYKVSPNNLSEDVLLGIIARNLPLGGFRK